MLQNLDFVRKRETVPSFTQEELETAVVSKHVSSLQKGYELVAHAAKNNLADIQNGILIGGLNKGFCEISRSQGLEIYEDISSREIELEHSVSDYSTTKTCRSVLKPGTEASSLHVLYRKGEDVIYDEGNVEAIGRINNIHSVTTEDEDGRNTVHLFVEVQVYENVEDDDSEINVHSGTQSEYLQLSLTFRMVNIISVLRKAILYPDPATPQQYILIDFQSPSLPPHKKFVVVPFYPEKNDMVLVLGQDDNQWIGKIISVQEDDKTVSVYFFKEHPRWQKIYQGKLYAA